MDVQPTPRGAAALMEHMIEEHGHDDLDDNPGLKAWGDVEWTEQHDEDHAAGNPDHTHPAS